jgi:hypothetical protein
MGAAALLRHHPGVVTKPLSLALALAFCLDAGAADPFAAATFAPTQKLPPPAKLQQRSAPPLPFRYVGRLVANGKLEVLLMRGEQLFSIAAGDRIGEDYLVERVGESSISFTYLPLKTKQHMDLPGVN